MLFYFFRLFGLSECLRLFLAFGQPPRYWDEYHAAAGILWPLRGRELHDNDKLRLLRNEEEYWQCSNIAAEDIWSLGLIAANK